MKSIGVSRPVDSLGRIVIPIELRRGMDISHGDLIEIYTDGDYIVLEKCQKSCVFCGSHDVSIDYGEKSLCSNCFENLKKLKK